MDASLIHEAAIGKVAGEQILKLRTLGLTEEEAEKKDHRRVLKGIMTKELDLTFTKVMTDWYAENKRDLPWRIDKNPYHVWVSEIMLQQTRVEAVRDYYIRFMNELPAVKDLAQADEQTLLKLWQGLGYYNRIRNMHKAATVIEQDFGGIFPKTYEDIKSPARHRRLYGWSHCLYLL